MPPLLCAPGAVRSIAPVVVDFAVCCVTCLLIVTPMIGCTPDTVKVEQRIMGCSIVASFQVFLVFGGDTAVGSTRHAYRRRGGGGGGVDRDPLTCVTPNLSESQKVKGG